MELLAETAERLKDIQKTNHEILLELAKLEEKQLRRRTEMQHSSTTQKAQTTPPSSDVANSASQPQPVNPPVDPAAQFTLTTEMMNYLCLLRRGKRVSDLHDNRLYEKFGLQPYKGSIMKPTDKVTKSGSEKATDQHKVEHLAIPEMSKSGGQSSSNTQRSTSEGQRLKQAARSKPDEHRSTHRERPKKEGQRQRPLTKSRPDGHRSSGTHRSRTHSNREVVKAQPGTRQGDQSLVPAEMSQLMQGGMMQQLMSGFTMAFNPLTGVVKVVDEADVQSLISQARTQDSQVVILKSDTGENCMRIVYGRELLREITSMMNNEEHLAELTHEQRNLLQANRAILQLMTENETVPFDQYMHVLGGVINTEGIMDQVKQSVETTMAALQDPSRCHQIPQPKMFALPSSETAGSPSSRPTQQRVLPPASSSPQSQPQKSQSSTSVKTQPDKPQSSGTRSEPGGKARSTAGRSGKQPLTGSPNIAPQQAGSQGSGEGTSQSPGSRDTGSGGGANTGSGALQRPAAYSHTGPALVPSACMPTMPGPASSSGPSTTMSAAVSTGIGQHGGSSGLAQSTDTELTPEEEASVVYIDESTWSEVANQQVEQGATARSIRERGMDTIICLDLSQSMAGEPWKQATAFIKGFIEGIQNTTLMDDVYEHVGLVTFGSETKVQQHMTCDYVEVLRKLGKLSPGGPSPLSAGMTMVYAALNGAGSVFVAHGYKINPRVFLLTDGRPTPGNMIAGPDKCSQEKRDMEKFKVAEVLATIHKKIPITLNVVPLGDFDSTLLERLATMTGGKMVAPDDWQSHTNTFRNYHAASKVGAMMKGTSPGLVGMFLDAMGASQSSQDRLEMEEFLQKHKRDMADDSDSEEYQNMPHLGARVRRNIAVYSEERPEIVGTITKHFDDGYVGVTWDEVNEEGTEHEKVPYRDSYKGVIVCDEPRALRDELIAVGCRVRRGSDWRYSDQDGGAGKLGSVYHVNPQGIVKVRWDVGRKNTYRFGQDGVYFDVEIVEDRSTIDKKKPDKTAEPAVDPVEEMNRKNKAASANIMDSISASGVNIAGRDCPASHRNDSPVRDREPGAPTLKLGSQASSGGRDSPARSSKNSPARERKASSARDRETVTSTLKLDSQTASTSQPSSAEDKAINDHADSVNQGPATSVEPSVTGVGASVQPGSKISPKPANTNGTKTNGARPKAVLPPEEIKWCWNNNGTWQLYPAEVCGRIETSFRRNPKGTALVKVGDTQFRIVFSRMEQVNIETRDKFPVRRK